jgi:hypothetical protein
MSYPARHIAITISRPWREVYDFAANPDNLTRWASGLATSDVEREGEALVASSPMGSIRIVFAPQNPYGVLDHDVTLPSGQTVHNPMRVMPNGESAEVVFTLYEIPGMNADTIEDDAGMIESDLATLKTLLET